jgi:CBS domain-containing protein/anti-sigma regulatory factor (Ser/Thr protein kinase)
MTDQTRFKGQIISDQLAGSITRTEELAYELKISDVMARNPVTTSTGMSMEEALDIFNKHRISGAPVMEDGSLVGVISIEDLIHSLRKNDLVAPVRNYMTTQLVTVRETDTVIEALKLFVHTKLGRLIVINPENQLAGIITKGDVTRGILKALDQDYQEEEVRIYRASHLFEDISSDRSTLVLRYNIKVGDFTKGGAASSNIKRALLRMGATPQLARRCGIAVYEAEMNLIIHTTKGGVLRVEIEPDQISMQATDEGPGIEDIDLAMKPGYSTATQEVRELGFGAGMGLVNIKRCVDWMELESTPGVGTKLRFKIFLKEEDTVGEGYPSSTKEPNKDESSGSHRSFGA